MITLKYSSIALAIFVLCLVNMLLFGCSISYDTQEEAAFTAMVTSSLIALISGTVVVVLKILGM